MSFAYSLKIPTKRVDTFLGMFKRLNPVELLIFAVVTAGFGFSGYTLMQDRTGFESSLLEPMASNPVSETRAPASAPLFSQIDFKCAGNPPSISVAASKIRINGPICPSGSAPLARASITNATNQFAATVFTDAREGRFSTDYIPLNPEKNTIRLEFSYEGGKSLHHELTLIKN
ncbi:MAG: hypothetical protein ACK5QT_07685 [Oligoflexia bacterium]|jgi:hypothetical protein